MDNGVLHNLVRTILIHLQFPPRTFRMFSFIKDKTELETSSQKTNHSVGVPMSFTSSVRTIFKSFDCALSKSRLQTHANRSFPNFSAHVAHSSDAHCFHLYSSKLFIPTFSICLEEGRNFCVIHYKHLC